LSNCYNFAIYTRYALAYSSSDMEKEATDAKNMVLKYAEDEVPESVRQFF